jgi:uncharacterized protein involved in exopolysaccharide biosynthesis
MSRATRAAAFLHPRWQTLFRHRGKALCLFTAVMAGAVIATLLWPRAYASQAKLLVRLGRENVTLDPTATIGQAPAVVVPPSRENEINSVIEAVRSRALLEQVVDALGPEAILGEGPAGEGGPTDSSPEAKARRARAATRLGRLLQVEAVKKSNVIAITYEGPTPELAQAVVTKLVELSLDYHLLLNRAPRAPQFLADQAERLRKELAASEARLKELKDRTGLVAPEGQRQGLVTRLARLEDELLQAEAARAAGEAEVSLLRKQLAALPATEVTARTRGLPNQAADAMRAQIFALEVEESKLLARYPAQGPEVKLVRKQIAAAKAVLAREEAAREQVTVGPSRAREEARLALLKQEATLASLKARAEALRGQMQKGRDAARALNEGLLAVTRQEREVKLQESLYQKYAESLEQARIDKALTQERISNISIVQPATYELEPARPRKGLILGCGLVLAVLGSLGVALLAEQLGAARAAEGTQAPPAPRASVEPAPAHACS